MSSSVVPRAPGRSARSGSAATFVAFLLIGLLVAALGALTTTPVASAWLLQGRRPPLAPPLVAVTGVWTTLHLLDGVAGWLLDRRVTHTVITRGAMLLWWVQLGLQVGWLLAFLAQAPAGGVLAWAVFGLLLLLDLVTAATMWTAWSVSRPAAAILVALLGWELFVTTQAWQDLTLRTLGGA